MALPYLRGLAHGIDEVGRGHGHQIARATVDMLTMLFGAALGTAPPEAEDRRARQRDAVEQWIGRNLLAAEHFMSTRTLHSLFAEVGTTVGEVVRGHRLALAGELLMRHPGLPVAEVARRAGFADPSYFARSFRRRFGCAPSRFRDGGC